jgi:hypothetical protein
MNTQEFINELVESVKGTKVFSTMTNKELAELLLNEVWTDMDIYTRKSDMVSAVIDRLRGDK